MCTPGMLKQQEDNYQGRLDGLRGDVEALRAEVKVRRRVIHIDIVS